jgi:hypothetical protein
MTVQRLAGIALFVSFLALSVAAQAQPPVITTWNAGKLHPCTGDSVPVTESMVYNPIAGGEHITLTVLGQTKEWTDYNLYMAERSNFIHGSIEMAGLQCSGGSVVSMPAAVAAATFTQTVFNHQAVPRMAGSATRTTASVLTPASSPAAAAATGGAAIEAPAAGGASIEAPAPVAAPAKEGESGKAVELKVAKTEAAPKLELPPNLITTDVEWDLFKHKESSGNNFALRAGYSRTLSNEKVTVGGTLIVNTLLMMNKTFFNNALNLYGNYLLNENSSLERRVGASVNMFLVDKEFAGTPFGMSIVANYSDNWFIKSDNIVTYGVMAQQSFLGDIKTTLLTAGVLFGLPIGNRYAFNPSCVLAYNVLTIGKNGTVSVESPFMLQPAANGSIYFSKLFTLDVGAKTTLLITDYHDLIVTVGTTILF